MGLIFSLETSTNVCSTAIHRDGHLVALAEVLIQKSHSEIITLLTGDLLAKCKLRLEDMDAFALSSGPGSYTGLRIGSSTVKGFCFATEKPMIAINTLSAMGALVNQFNYENALICPMLDARRMEVFCLTANASNKILSPPEAKIINEFSFRELLEKEKVLFFGNGADKCKPYLKGDKNAVFIDNIYPSAKGIGELAELSFREKKFENVAYFEPNYLKEFFSPSLKQAEK